MIKNLQIKLCYPVENIFQDVVNTITDIKIDKINYPDKTFYFNNDKLIADYNSKNNDFCCDYANFWLKFKLNDSFSMLIISNLLNSMVKERFELMKIIAYPHYSYCPTKIEEHFK